MKFIISLSCAPKGAILDSIQILSLTDVTLFCGSVSLRLQERLKLCQSQLQLSPSLHNRVTRNDMSQLCSIA